ncbi:hypothetical protein JTB14_002907 [Gonioctena quinquepunctata]|nr:hypothetical protein JTB14_002907 [Gonioctena quinquepunctata]
MKDLCILCLKTTETKKCAESELFIELLDIFLLNPWWNISQTPTLCYNCSMQVARAFGFKANCIYTEDLLKPHIKFKSNSKVDLRNAYLKMKKYEIEKWPARKHLKICCLCINLINSSSTYIEDLLKEYNFKDKFKKYIPEMDLENIDDPLICQQCNDNLRDFIKFATSCIDTSSRIQKYCERLGLTDSDQIDLDRLSSVIDKLRERDINLPNPENISDTDVLMELIKEENVDVDYRSGSILPSENQATDIKNEEIEIESHDLASNLMQSPDKSNEKTKKQKSLKRKRAKKSNDKIPSSEKMPKRDEETDNSNETSFKCSHCDFKTAVKSRLGKHVRRKHYDLNTRKFSCNKCDYQTTERYYLTRHSLRHKDASEVEIYRCEKCTYETRYKDHLKGHLLTHLGKDEAKIYRCENCNFTTKFKGGLTQHKRIHNDSKIKTYKCGMGNCTYQTIEKSYLNKHIKRHGKPPEMETLYCLKCDYQTKYKKHLRNHVLVHDDKYEVIRCKLCKYKTQVDENLQKHIRRKHG